MAIKRKEVKKFKVGGVEIVIGDKYVLDNKFDSSAPEALQKIESTKFPFTGSGVTDCINFDYEQGLFDTGFYENSYCLSQYSEEERDELVKVYNSQIKEPLEKLRNANLEPSEENKFWTSYRYEAHANKEFDTKKASDLMELFQVIIQGIACDKNEKNPFYRNNAQFTISNPTSVKNKEKEKTKVRIKAFQKLTTLADADKDKLDLVLEFIGKSDTRRIEAEDLKLIYFEVFNDKKSGISQAETFIEACDDYETENGKVKMEFFYAINQLFRLRKIQKDRRGYTTLEGVYLGNSLQDIAKFCLNDTTPQYKAIERLIDENPKVRREA